MAAFQKAGLGSIYKFKLPSHVNLKAAISDFRKSPDVEYAEPNYIYKISGMENAPYLSSEGSWGQPYKDLWCLYQIAAGGDSDQYKTEVILLGTGDSRVMLKYLSDDGSPWPVAQ